VYNTYTDMIKAESALPAEQRVDFVAVTTPNNWHFPIARDFLKAGFHVMCEKPMTITSKEAKELQRLVQKKGLVFGLMHNIRATHGEAGP
jgi:predicted dehydrogenase